MRYNSTRGGSNGLTFEAAVLRGLAPDGGLYVPDSIPTVDTATLERWQDLPFYKLAAEILSLYIGDEISSDDLEDLTQRSYKTFTHELVTPVQKLSNELYVLELFHGPTFAFKDVALQFLGNLFEFFLNRTKRLEGSVKPLTILGATSGDTGSAAIYGLRGKENIDVFILHPKGRVAPVQELQMTTVLDSNVHNIAVDGSFDDCQHIVKEAFGDEKFNARCGLAAINSINWARILAQIVYYFFSYFQYRKIAGLENDWPKIMYSVPTGNFGDVLAGFYAKAMGLPVERLIVATNTNDILHRFLQTGKMKQTTVVPTIAPAMDIQISSNFERYLYYLFDKDTTKLSHWMAVFKVAGAMTVDDSLLKKTQEDFISYRTDEDEIRSVIGRYFQDCRYTLCPHTACSLAAADHCLQARKAEDAYQGPIICLATAHPAKFGDAVKEATGQEPVYPAQLEAVKTMESRCYQAANDTEDIKRLILAHSTLDLPGLDAPEATLSVNLVHLAVFAGALAVVSMALHHRLHGWKS